MHMHLLRSGVLIAAAAAALTACGGGGGAFSQSPEGAYGGTVTGSPLGANSQQMVVLENNQAWSIYGKLDSNGVYALQGFVQGNGEVAGNQIVSADARDYVIYSAMLGVPAAVRGTFAPGSSLNGTITYGNANLTVTFTGSTANVAPYAYATPAQVSAVTGTWNFTNADGTAAVAQVQVDGSFTSTSVLCTTSGTFKPRASGKNVFDVTVQTGGLCLHPNTTFTGIAVNWPLATGQTQLIVAGISADRNKGLLAAMVR